jgi:hypothetical protein
MSQLEMPDAPPSRSGDGPTQPLTVTLPVQPDTQTTKYVINSPCSPYPLELNSSGSGFQPTGQIAFASTCATTDIVAAKLDTNGAIVGYFLVAGQAITSNGALDYTAKSFTTATNRTYTFNNKPSQLTALNVAPSVPL